MACLLADAERRLVPPEIDIFEGFWLKAPPADLLTMTLHWRNAAGASRAYGTNLYLAQIIPSFDVRAWHTYGAYIEADWISYFVDDVPVWRVPNATRRGTTWYPLFDVTTGGLVGEPTPDARCPRRWASTGSRSGTERAAQPKIATPKT